MEATLRLALRTGALAALAAAWMAPPAAAQEGGEATPEVVAEFSQTGGIWFAGRQSVRIAAGGEVEVEFVPHGSPPRSSPVIERFRLSRDERVGLANLVRSVDFFRESEPSQMATCGGETSLRIGMEGRIRASKWVRKPSLAPLESWFHRFLEQGRLVEGLRRGKDVGRAAGALNPKGRAIVAQRDPLRSALIGFVDRSEDPIEILVALGGLAWMEGPESWGPLVVRKASSMSDSGGRAVLEGILFRDWRLPAAVTDAHRAALRPEALAVLEARVAAWDDLDGTTRDRTRSLAGELARARYEPLFSRILEWSGEGGERDPPLGLGLLHHWGERGFEAALPLLSSDEAVVRRRAVLAVGAFRYESRGVPLPDAPVSEEERTRVRRRLLDEALPVLDALGEEASAGKELRNRAREAANAIRNAGRGAFTPPPGAPPPPPGLSLVVLDEEDRPVAGVCVVAFPADRGGRPPPDDPLTSTAVSDDAGKVRFRLLTGGEWEFDVEDPAWVRRASSRFPVHEGVRGGLRLLVRRRRSLSGRLVGNAGRPLAGASVLRIRRDGTPLPGDGEHLSDGKGRVSLPEVPGGDADRLRVRLADGRDFLLETRFLTEGQDWSVDLGPPGEGDEVPAIQGRVVDPRGGGIAGSVTVVAEGDPSRKPVATTWARADGTFEVYGLAPGEYRVWAKAVDARGNLDRRGPGGSALVEGVPVRDVRIEVPRGDSITGRLVDAHGAPVVGVHLLAQRAAEPAVAGPGHGGGTAQPPVGITAAAASTDERGRFVLDDLMEGEYVLAMGPGTPFVLDGDPRPRPGDRDLTVRAFRVEPLTGSVHSEDGRPLAGIAVVAVRHPDGGGEIRGETGADGTFALEGADPRRSYALRVDFEDGVSTEPTVVEAGVRVARLRADAGPLGTVVVKDRFGDPAVGMLIVLRHAETGRVFRRECDRAGEATLPCRLTGKWTVERPRERPGSARVLGTVESGIRGQEIRLPEEWE
jgi:hypothetical protein